MRSISGGGRDGDSLEIVLREEEILISTIDSKLSST